MEKTIDYNTNGITMYNRTRLYNRTKRYGNKWYHNQQSNIVWMIKDIIKTY